jgi:hypothetical protein
MFYRILHALNRRLGHAIGYEPANFDAPDRLRQFQLALYLPGDRQTVHHARMWLPSIIESGIACVLIVRKRDLFNALCHEWPTVAAIYARRGIDVERAVNALSSLKAALYPSNTGVNFHLLRYNHLTHVFVGHGDSDKAASVYKFFRAYDEVWTAGQGHVDRFQNAGFDLGHIEFVKIGRPDLRDIMLSVGQRSSSTQTAEDLKIVYLPTWEGFFEEQDYTSLRFADDIIAAFSVALKPSTFRIKLHPATGGRDTKLCATERDLAIVAAKETGVEIVSKELSLRSMISDADIYVCDISAAITECLVADKPIFVYRPRSKGLTLRQSAMPPEKFCYVFSDISQLKEVIREFVAEGDLLANARRDAQQYLFGAAETRARIFHHELKRITQEQGEL